MKIILLLVLGKSRLIWSCKSKAIILLAEKWKGLILGVYSRGKG